MKNVLRIGLLLKLVIMPGLLAAHSMGNFSISHHSTIHVSSDVISVSTILDFAEIATFQMFPDPRKASDHAAEWDAHLHLRADGRSLPLQVQDIRSELVPAATGLPHCKSGCRPPSDGPRRTRLLVSRMRTIPTGSAGRKLSFTPILHSHSQTGILTSTIEVTY